MAGSSSSRGPTDDPARPQYGSYDGTYTSQTSSAPMSGSRGARPSLQGRSDDGGSASAYPSPRPAGQGVVQTVDNSIFGLVASYFFPNPNHANVPGRAHRPYGPVMGSRRQSKAGHQYYDMGPVPEDEPYQALNLHITLGDSSIASPATPSCTRHEAQSDSGCSWALSIPHSQRDSADGDLQRSRSLCLADTVSLLHSLTTNQQRLMEGGPQQALATELQLQHVNQQLGSLLGQVQQQADGILGLVQQHASNSRSSEQLLLGVSNAFSCTTAVQTEPHPASGCSTAVQTEPHPASGCSTAVQTEPHPASGCSTAIQTEPHPASGCSTAIQTEPYPTSSCSAAVQTEPHPVSSSCHADLPLQLHGQHQQLLHLLQSLVQAHNLSAPADPQDQQSAQGSATQGTAPGESCSGPSRSGQVGGNASHQAPGSGAVASPALEQPTCSISGTSSGTVYAPPGVQPLDEDQRRLAATLLQQLAGALLANPLPLVGEGPWAGEDGRGRASNSSSSQHQVLQGVSLDGTSLGGDEAECHSLQATVLQLQEDLAAITQACNSQQSARLQLQDVLAGLEASQSESTSELGRMQATCVAALAEAAAARAAEAHLSGEVMSAQRQVEELQAQLAASDADRQQQQAASQAAALHSTALQQQLCGAVSLMHSLEEDVGVMTRAMCDHVSDLCAHQQTGAPGTSVSHESTGSCQQPSASASATQLPTLSLPTHCAVATVPAAAAAPTALHQEVLASPGAVQHLHHQEAQAPSRRSISPHLASPRASRSAASTRAGPQPAGPHHHHHQQEHHHLLQEQLLAEQRKSSTLAARMHESQASQAEAKSKVHKLQRQLEVLQKEHAALHAQHTRMLSSKMQGWQPHKDPQSQEPQGHPSGQQHQPHKLPGGSPRHQAPPLTSSKDRQGSTPAAHSTPPLTTPRAPRQHRLVAGAPCTPRRASSPVASPSTRSTKLHGITGVVRSASSLSSTSRRTRSVSHASYMPVTASPEPLSRSRSVVCTSTHPLGEMHGCASSHTREQRPVWVTGLQSQHASAPDRSPTRQPSTTHEAPWGMAGLVRRAPVPITGPALGEADARAGLGATAAALVCQEDREEGASHQGLREAFQSLHAEHSMLQEEARRAVVARVVEASFSAVRRRADLNHHLAHRLRERTRSASITCPNRPASLQFLPDQTTFDMRLSSSPGDYLCTPSAGRHGRVHNNNMLVLVDNELALDDQRREVERNMHLAVRAALQLGEGEGEGEVDDVLLPSGASSPGGCGHGLQRSQEPGVDGSRSLLQATARPVRVGIQLHHNPLAAPTPDPYQGLHDMGVPGHHQAPGNTKAKQLRVHGNPLADGIN